MAYVITLDDTLPIARTDGIPWTEAVIEEAPDITGPWTAIATIALAPDSEPARPQPRDLTTNAATLEVGWYRVRFIDADGSVAVTAPTWSGQPSASSVTALIPRIRRALEGPTGGTLTDEQLKAIAADAIASVILFTGGLFGHQLVATSWDPAYGAPDDWDVEPPLSDAEATVVAAQAALDYVFATLRELKLQETIRDEGAEWSYTLSAGALRDHVKYLMTVRDQALEEVRAAQPIPTTFVSFLHERDLLTARAVEPFVLGA